MLEVMNSIPTMQTNMVKPNMTLNGDVPCLDS